MSENFIQHNPTRPDGPDRVKAVVQMLASQGVPKQKDLLKPIVANHDIVILHSRTEMAGKEWQFIDIYQIEKPKLAEHWDAMIEMTNAPAKRNPMFQIKVVSVKLNLKN